MTKKCTAFKKPVFYKHGMYKHGMYKHGVKSLDYFKDQHLMKCPECNKVFRAITCGFYGCQFQFLYETIKGGQIAEGETKWTNSSSNSLTYLDTDTNGSLTYLSLNISVKSKIKK